MYAIRSYYANNIKGNVVHVVSTMVQDEHKNWVIKIPKSYAGDRFIEYPDFVAALWKGKNGKIVSVPHPTLITNRFGKILKRAGIPHFRFHDLRHYSASILHALGVPDAYIMQRGGWGNDSVLKDVYRHTLDEKTESFNQQINNYRITSYNVCYTKLLRVLEPAAGDAHAAAGWRKRAGIVDQIADHLAEP